MGTYVRLGGGRLGPVAFCDMGGDVRLTPVGAVLFALMAAGLIALFFGSRTLQGIGFVVVLIGLLFLAGSLLSWRQGRQAGGDPRGPDDGPYGP